MIMIAELEELIKADIPDAAVNIMDRTGTGDHYLIYVEAKSFESLSLMDRHRKVMGALSVAMEDGRLHAAEIKTSVPA